MDFYRIREKRETKNKVESVTILPDFVVRRSKDLMLRGGYFYAIWDEEEGLWSTDELDVASLVDADLWAYADAKKYESFKVLTMSNFDTGSWTRFGNYMRRMPDTYTQLDATLTFANTDVVKKDHVSKRLPYSLAPGSTEAYEQMISTLYSPEERRKIEWAIGAVVAGEAKDIQKFIVMYGSAGTGKSTILNIIQDLFEGYYAVFEAKALTSNSNAFSTEPFKTNPLVAIQHDGDLSKIEDNTKLNSIVSHEEIPINEKFKPSYPARINAFLFMGTNKAVKITDAKSGIIRRLIDVQPTGEKIPPQDYHILKSKISFELGAIAQHCLDVYHSMGADFYDGYRPIEMMLQTDPFYNFVEESFDIFKSQDGVSLSQAYTMYKEYAEESAFTWRYTKMQLREELKNYFHDFSERHTLTDGERVRSWFSGFKKEKFVSRQGTVEAPLPLEMTSTVSLLDDILKDCPAQLATDDGIPQHRWDDVKTTLSDISTDQTHYVRVPENHIVIDFDLKDEHGHKSAERNLRAASEFPRTYGEFSQGGSGVHLHYYYAGDPGDLARDYSEGIEVKVFQGKSSLRRRLSRCNSLEVAHISEGLPLKNKETKVLTDQTMKSEKGLRDLIERNLAKEIHPGTKPSIDFIKKILDDAYTSGMPYDVTNMRPRILAFANNSSNQALTCIKTVAQMKFASEGSSEDATPGVQPPVKNDKIVFFDVEVFPNLFVVCWKFDGDPTVIRMLNPNPQRIEELLELKLVGFNNRRYDNHILYAAFLGYSNEDLYKLSKNIIDNKTGSFGEAYNLSYADIYEFSSKKQSLKKFEIELGIKHMENSFPWDEPLDKKDWQTVADYCANDVEATEAVFHARKGDWTARQILADISGLPINATTQKHTAQIVFAGDKEAKQHFVYTDLSEEFPGYSFDAGKSSYKGEDPSEGGYVYAEPGMYSNVAVLDIASMHPTSIKELNLFGKYTKNFVDLRDARVAIKHGDYDTAKSMLNGKLAPYLNDEGDAADLSYALKIVINIVYGMTSAKFENPFNDKRNRDNIVAKRGALFMIDLKEYVQSLGYSVAHIKTDSIKIPDVDDKIMDAIMEFGEKYGYIFEHEETFEKFCLVNDAVYVGKTLNGRSPAHWTATGAQFQHPYVFKNLFTNEDIQFDDLVETKQVTSEMYLDFDISEEGTHGEAIFIGRIGQFVPVTEEGGGGRLLRKKDGKWYAVTGTKDWLWMEAHMVTGLNKQEHIDYSYYEKLLEDAKASLRNFGDLETFLA